MQLPVTAPQRPWHLPKDLDLPILAHLSQKDCLAFLRVSRGCYAIIERLDKELFADSCVKPERFKQLSWRKIASNLYQYPKSTKAERRSNNPTIKDISQIKRLGQMICLNYKEERRLIDYKANLFRILPVEDNVVHTSFLSALIFRKGRYEIFDRHFQTPIKMPEGVQVDQSNSAIMCYGGEKAAIIVSSQGKKRLALADRSCVNLCECAFDGEVKIHSLNELLAIVNGLSVTLLGLDGTIKKTLKFESAISKCKVSAKEYWIATQREIFVYDKKSLNEKKVFQIANPNVMYVNGYLVEFRAQRFIITGEKIVYSESFDGDWRLNYYKEVNGLLYLKLNYVAFVYDLKENKLTQIDTGNLIGSDHFWIENHLVLITGFGVTYKMVG